MSKAPFPVDPQLTAMTIAYRNPAYIADEALPRVPVGSRQFKWWKYPVEETFARPDTKVGRKSRPNEVDLSATEEESGVVDYGLDDPIPQQDIDNAPPNRNPRDRAAMQLTDYIMLDREKRTADLLFDDGNYGANNKVTLAGNDQWSDFVNSDPINDIMTALDACLIRPNTMTMGNAVFTVLRQHPKIAKAIHGNSGDVAIAARRAIAELFEISTLLVGQSRLNTAKKGQAAALSRIWGKHCALYHLDRNADTGGGVTFGFTAEHGSRVSGDREDPDIGLRGGVRVRVGESVKELIVAPDCGYFFKNAVA